MAPHLNQVVVELWASNSGTQQFLVAFITALVRFVVLVPTVLDRTFVAFLDFPYKMVNFGGLISQLFIDRLEFSFKKIVRASDQVFF